MICVLTLATITLPGNWLLWGAGLVAAYLLFAGGGTSEQAIAQAAAPVLPFDPPAKLDPTVRAFEQLHNVRTYLDGKGLAGDALAHVDALAALINRRV